MAHDDVRSQIDAVLAAYRRRVSEDWERVYADVEDLLAPSLELDAWERALYYHLLRHTRLERREAAGFAIEPLSEAVGISDTKAREVLRSLHRKGCVRIEERSRTGHLVAVLLPADIPGLVRRSDDVVQVDVAALDFTDRRYVPALVAREGGACFYCLKRLTDKTCELDHLAPQVDGLDNSYRNIVAACFNCNKTKGGMLAADLVRQLYREGVLNEKELQLRLAAIVAVQSGQLVPDVGRAAAPKATKRVDPVGRFRGQAIFIESRFAAERRCWRTQHGSMSHADLRWRPLHPDWDHD